jgi:transcriptional regulator with XRE-family HTH domain
VASGPVRLTPRLCRAARALLGWRQTDLAARSGVPEPTIQAFEAKEDGGRMATLNNKAVIDAFEQAGLSILPENGGGFGVRFTKPSEG